MTNDWFLWWQLADQLSGDLSSMARYCWLLGCILLLDSVGYLVAGADKILGCF